MTSAKGGGGFTEIKTSLDKSGREAEVVYENVDIPFIVSNFFYMQGIKWKHNTSVVFLHESIHNIIL